MKRLIPLAIMALLVIGFIIQPWGVGGYLIFGIGVVGFSIGWQLYDRWPHRGPRPPPRQPPRGFLSEESPISSFPHLGIGPNPHPRAGVNSSSSIVKMEKKMAQKGGNMSISQQSVNMIAIAVGIAIGGSALLCIGITILAWHFFG